MPVFLRTVSRFPIFVVVVEAIRRCSCRFMPGALWRNAAAMLVAAGWEESTTISMIEAIPEGLAVILRHYFDAAFFG